jgi:hypothetical protein
MIKLTKRKGFNFFRSYYDVYNELETNEDKVAFIDALLDRQFLGVKPTNLKGMAKFAYISQTNSIDSQVKGYEDKTKTILTPTVGGAQGGNETPIEQVEEKVQVKEKVKEEDINKPLAFSFYNSLINYGFKKELVSDWLKVRKNKKLTNTETAFNKFIIEVEKTNLDKNKVLEDCVSNSWGGFKNEWVNKQSTTNTQKYDIDELRRQFPDL